MKESVQWTALRISKLIKNEFFIILLKLSDNNQKHAQNNTVVPSWKEMDRVGVEPTTSAILAFFYLRAATERELKC
jgi:hypothetical protein